MPTASEYQTAAATCLIDSESMADLQQAVAKLVDDPGVGGGLAKQIVEEALKSIAAKVQNIGTLARYLNLAFTNRATLCQEYTDEMQQWRSDTARWERRQAELSELNALGAVSAGPGPAPVEPERPFPQAEEG